MKQGDKITIEKVMRSRGKVSPTSHFQDRSFSNKERAPFDYLKKSETPQYGLPEDYKKLKHGNRQVNNQSYVAVDKRRFPSSRKEEVKQINNTSYALPFMNKTKLYETENLNKRRIDVEAFNDSELQLDNSNILNVVSPKDQSGFHITDLLDHKKHASKRPQLAEIDPLDRQSMFDRLGSNDSKGLMTHMGNRTMKSENRYMIKNFRLINLSNYERDRPLKSNKPITAAPMSYNSSGARAIKKITSGASSRKERFNSTTNVWRGAKSPGQVPINNSLLSTDEKGQYTDMRPIDNYFEQLYEQTHYMFPKHKAKIGVNPIGDLPYRKPQSVTRAHKVKPIEESEAEHRSEFTSQDKNVQDEDATIKYLREQASKDRTGTLLVRQDRENRAELEYLLQKSLKYHKEKHSKKGTPVESMSDEDKLNIIMQTWLTEDSNDPAYLLDNIEAEAKMTSHMIVNTRDNKSIYPEEIKDAEIDIYLRNRKNIPKYELLQYMKFSNNDNDEKNTKDSSSPKEEEKEENEDEYDINVG